MSCLTQDGLGMEKTNMQIRFITTLLVAQVVGKLVQCLCFPNEAHLLHTVGEKHKRIRPLRVLRCAMRENRKA